MYTKLNVLFIVLVPLIGTAQDVNQQVIASAGHYENVHEIELSWTLGQVVGSSSVTNQIHLSEGFHQSSLTLVIPTALPISEQILKVFPNPVVDKVSIESQTLGKGRYELVNLEGKVMMTKESVDFSTMQIIPMGEYPGGIYLLTIETEKDSKQFKIIKH